MYPFVLKNEYEKELAPRAYYKKTGVKSAPQDDTWNDDSPYNDPKKFKNAIDHIFDDQFCERLFGPNNVIKQTEFLESFNAGMMERRVDLNWIFNLKKVRKIYHECIDKGLGDKELEYNQIEQIQMQRKIKGLMTKNIQQ